MQSHRLSVPSTALYQAPNRSARVGVALRDRLPDCALAPGTRVATDNYLREICQEIT